MSKTAFSPFFYIGSGVLVAAFLTGSLISEDSAYAVTNKECHKQFTAAKKDGSVKGQSFKEFKSANCQDKSAVKDEPEKGKKADKADRSDQAPVKEDKTTSDKGDSNSSSASHPSRSSAVDAGDAVFPTTIASKYASEKEGSARMHTCLDQYRSNKETNKNGTLKWIQKGGGYYSECVKRLKGK